MPCNSTFGTTAQVFYPGKICISLIATIENSVYQTWMGKIHTNPSRAFFDPSAPRFTL